MAGWNKSSFLADKNQRRQHRYLPSHLAASRYIFWSASVAHQNLWTSAVVGEVACMRCIQITWTAGCLNLVLPLFCMLPVPKQRELETTKFFDKMRWLKGLASQSTLSCHSLGSIQAPLVPGQYLETVATCPSGGSPTESGHSRIMIWYDMIDMIDASKKCHSWRTRTKTIWKERWMHITLLLYMVRACKHNKNTECLLYMPHGKGWSPTALHSHSTTISHMQPCWPLASCPSAGARPPASQLCYNIIAKLCNVSCHPP